MKKIVRRVLQVLLSPILVCFLIIFGLVDLIILATDGLDDIREAPGSMAVELLRRLR